ncbi:MAG: hypothetical protein HW383_115 [Candidatus Magasanikbacteria bacterium]|nr:hypothetical protein [Candidatus Magasanikbacteria bacterium]
MKFFIAITVALLVIISVGAFSGMGRGAQNGRCLAAIAFGAECPNERHTDDSMAFHFAAFRNFTNAVIVDFIFLGLLGAVFFLSFYTACAVDGTRFVKTRQRLFLKAILQRQKSFLRWLAQLEFSPSLI